MTEKALQVVQVDAWESLRTADIDERAAALRRGLTQPGPMSCSWLAAVCRGNVHET